MVVLVLVVLLLITEAVEAAERLNAEKMASVQKAATAAMEQPLLCLVHP
jgi:hypothetical protein